MKNNNLEDSEILPFDIPVEMHQQLLQKALEKNTTLDAVVERGLQIGLLHEAPYPKATAEERLKIQSELAKLND